MANEDPTAAVAASKKRPFYSHSVACLTAACRRDGRFAEKLGTYKLRSCPRTAMDPHHKDRLDRVEAPGSTSGRQAPSRPRRPASLEGRRSSRSKTRNNPDTEGPAPGKKVSGNSAEGEIAPRRTAGKPQPRPAVKEAV